LGASVSFAGKVGMDDFGKKVLLDLQKAGVSTELIIRDQDRKTGITVALNRGEDRAMITYPGAMEAFSANEITNDKLQEADHLHVSSVFLQPEIRKNLHDLLKRAKASGLTTSLDPQWDPNEEWDLDLESLMQHLDLFLPNEQEFRYLTGSYEIEVAARQLPGECIIVVKQGNRGATLFHWGEKIYRQAYTNPEPADAIGAGDSFDAGFIFRYIRDAPLEECLGFGNLVGAVSTTAAGGTAAIQSLSQVEEVGKQQFDYDPK
ncbi:MAG: carbohydrate kinase family protein, partial [Balneolaceae bacterium]|nr:carbohydrate kinase family protein [Balneolaceae bacterium]